MNPTTEQRAKSATLAALLTPVAVGLIYVGASCERYSPGAGKCESQWVTALAISGMGGAWSAGFWQPNQVLRERERRLMKGGGDDGMESGGSPEPPDGEGAMVGVEDEGTGEPVVERYEAAELAGLTVEELRVVARRVGLRDVARHGRRAHLIAALTDVEKASS